MAHFHTTTAKGVLFLICAISLYSPTDGQVGINGTFPIATNSRIAQVITDLISSLIKADIKVNIEQTTESRRHINDHKDDLPSVIKRKVSELKHVLEDDKFSIPATQDDFTLEGEETTIIEIMPSKNHSRRALQDLDEKQESLKSNMLNYKLMRRKINKALAREYVSDHTKIMVTATIDDLMAKIIEHQCIWNNPAPRLAFRAKSGRSQPLAMAKTWTNVWSNLRNRYLNVKKMEEKEKFFRDFENFVGVMINDMETLSQNYKVVCKVVDQSGVELVASNKPSPRLVFTTEQYADKNPARQSPDSHEIKKKIDITVDGNDKCANFKICSEELIEFMAEFYKTLNDTAVGTLRTYAAMFKRDVDPKGKFERENIVQLVDNIAVQSEINVELIFRKKVLQFQILNKIKKINRIEAIQSFVEGTILETKKTIKNTTIEKLKILRFKLFDTIKKDVYVNLDVDLGNLEREINGRICTVFQTCNGRYIVGRRSENLPNLGNRDIYVKVQLKLNDEVKDELYKKVQQRSLMGVNKTITDDSYRVLVTRTSPIAWVTRTTAAKKKPHEYTKGYQEANDSDQQNTTINNRATIKKVIFTKSTTHTNFVHNETKLTNFDEVEVSNNSNNQETNNLNQQNVYTNNKAVIDKLIFIKSTTDANKMLDEITTNQECNKRVSYDSNENKVGEVKEISTPVVQEKTDIFW